MIWPFKDILVSFQTFSKPFQKLNGDHADTYNFSFCYFSVVIVQAFLHVIENYLVYI